MTRMVRSIMVVLVGFGVTVLLFLGIGWVVDRITNVGVVPWHSPGLHTPASLLVTAGHLLFSVAAGAFVASWLSRGREVRHAVPLGVLMSLLALLDGAPPGYVQPQWFTITMLVILVPAATCGGLASLVVRRLGASSQRGG